jgi:hypothetical protein
VFLSLCRRLFNFPPLRGWRRACSSGTGHLSELVRMTTPPVPPTVLTATVQPQCWDSETLRLSVPRNIFRSAFKLQTP